MAQKSAGKRNTTTKSAAQKKRSDSAASRAKPAKAVPVKSEAPRPIHRELLGVFFLFLSICVIVSYFKDDGTLLVKITEVVRGLTGFGYWIFGGICFLIFLILIFHKGRPVKARVICALFVPVLFGSLSSLFNTISFSDDSEFRFICDKLFEFGKNADPRGGLFSGLITYYLSIAITNVGAGIVIFILFVVCMIVSFRNVFADNAKPITERIAEMATAQYDPQDYFSPDITEEFNAAELFENNKKAVSKKTSAPTPEATERKPANKKSKVDLPLGSEDSSGNQKKIPIGTFDLTNDEELFPKRRKTPVKADSSADIPLVDAAPAKTEAAAAVSAPPLGSRKKPDSEEKTSTAGIKSPRDKVDFNNSPRQDAVIDSSDNICSYDKNAASDFYCFPPADLLNLGYSTNINSNDEIFATKNRLEQALHSFGINSAIVSYTRGPTVTRYDIELEQGVKLARVTNLAGDIALSLGVVNVRIAPIPDKMSTVGIEVPNKIVSTVYLREIIQSDNFVNAKSKISFALGKNISGECVVGNISKLPHMLIAGTTGSGKSVCMNSLILSILYKASPEEVRFIMIDPKMVELGIYNGIPHLYVPVVTEPKKAAGALQWAVVEMLKRYRLFSEASVRDLASYNSYCASASLEKLPQIVIVVDELADLMLVASKDVEESICRIAQMGRAAGMHLVIATQRPSADVITGLMKANIPSRIAFAVSSSMESRIILDQGGAEKLVGMGDMLYSPVGCGKPMRIQGAFVSDEERERVIQYIKENSAFSNNNNEEIETYMNRAMEGKNSGNAAAASDEEESAPAGDYDEMLGKAVEIVIEMKSCSVSMLQRRLKLGYSRAARIVDQMEELNVVGPYEGSKPRAVVVDLEGWHRIQSELGMSPQ